MWRGDEGGGERAAIDAACLSRGVPTRPPARPRVGGEEAAARPRGQPPLAPAPREHQVRLHVDGEGARVEREVAAVTAAEEGRPS